MLHEIAVVTTKWTEARCNVPTRRNWTSASSLSILYVLVVQRW